METGTPERINQSSNIHFTTSAIDTKLTSSLYITNANRSYTGYYWVKLPFGDVCNVSLPVGTCTYVNRVYHTNQLMSYI